MKKVFILTQFGSSHEWTDKYIENVQHLEKYGWYWKIFTPNRFGTYGNVERIPMKIEEFNELVLKTCEIDPQVNIVNGFPSKPVSDFYVASGTIFQDYIKDFDYWGITNWDVVYGRLDHFIPDRELKKYDIWSDDVNTINGVFSLYKNIPKVNNLFREITDWKNKFVSSRIFGTDEYDMTDTVRRAAQEGRITFGYPPYYPLLSHDRLENHQTYTKLSLKEDGSLWDLVEDINPPQWIHTRPFIGREIPYFHFSTTKRWPNIVL